MAKLRLFDLRQLSRHFQRRSGETKFGENLNLLNSLDQLKEQPAKFVLLGIPEDIGVRANYGRPGTSSAWEAFIKAFLNVQDNLFNHPQDLLILGAIDCSAENEKASSLESSDPNYYFKLGDLLTDIDRQVSETLEIIIRAGKTPIIIGGGHNNAFGIIKGAASALNKSINALNIDAHTDLRHLEHRHSGNGFSYAMDRGFLQKYAIFGFHQNYTPQYIFDKIKASENIWISMLEDLKTEDKTAELVQAIEFVGEDNFGLELDCDSIANFPSSAASPSGFNFDEVRELVKIAANDRNCLYLHICEAMDNDNFPTGKAISYLVTDFMRLHTG